MQEKEDFLRHEYIAALSRIDPDTPPAWGKMSVRQMIEHMSDSFMIANGKDAKDCITPPEHLGKMQAFLMSDKPFRENTPNAQLPEEPLPLRFGDIRDSIGELEMQVADFFDIFGEDRRKIITNPFFGDLNFEQWVHLLYKHAWHHLRQFGVQR
jgi:hypothetical protein